MNALDVKNQFMPGFPSFPFLYVCSNDVSKFLNDLSSSFYLLHFDTRYFRSLPPSLPFITSLPFHLSFYPLHINHHRRISHPPTALHSSLLLITSYPTPPPTPPQMHNPYHFPSFPRDPFSLFLPLEDKNFHCYYRLFCSPAKS